MGKLAPSALLLRPAEYYVVYVHIRLVLVEGWHATPVGALHMSMSAHASGTPAEPRAMLACQWVAIVVLLASAGP